MLDLPFRRLSGILVLAGVVGCGLDESDMKASTDREAAVPVEGQTELLGLPHGDTLTVPVGYEFLKFQGIDSLVGRLQDGVGTSIFEYDSCGSAGERIGATDGSRDHSVNADFFYGRHPESWPGLLVTFPKRGPSNLIFDEAVSDEEALALARTLTALAPQADDASVKLCRLTER